MTANSTFHRVAALLACWVAVGCETEVKAPPSEPFDAGSTPDAQEPEPELCEGQDAGVPCGPGRHCIGGHCVDNICGDGIVAGDEECDDGDEILGDACNPACEFTPATCGNSKLDEGEECDDSNSINDDGCSNGCTINRCGNARRDPGSEECDDGNEVNNDYCSNTCTRNLCRNGRLDPGEQCDDGNAVHNDGCTNACEAIGCGDGVVITEDGPLKEECDDANDVDDDACSNSCTQNICGNLRIDPGEVCDGNQSPEGGICNDECSAFEADPCLDCMERECTHYQELDFFTPCRLLATPETMILGNTPSATFVEDCTALDHCARVNNCFDPIGLLIPCVCGELPIEECLAAPSLSGPCADEAIRATECDKVEDTPIPVCTAGNNSSDLTLASGYATFLSECRYFQCSVECGGS